MTVKELIEELQEIVKDDPKEANKPIRGYRCTGIVVPDEQMALYWYDGAIWIE